MCLLMLILAFTRKFKYEDNKMFFIDTKTKLCESFTCVFTGLEVMLICTKFYLDFFNNMTIE